MIKIEKTRKQDGIFHPKTNECWYTYVKAGYKIILFWVIPIYINCKEEKFTYDFKNNNLGFSK